MFAARDRPDLPFERPHTRFAGVAPFDSMREVRPDAGDSGDRTLSLNQLERAAVREALNRSAGNRRRAADYLGISERTLYNWVARPHARLLPSRAGSARRVGETMTSVLMSAEPIWRCS